MCKHLGLVLEVTKICNIFKIQMGKNLTIIRKLRFFSKWNLYLGVMLS